MKHFSAGLLLAVVGLLWTGCAPRVETSTGLPYRPSNRDRFDSTTRSATVRSEAGNAREMAQSPDSGRVLGAEVLSVPNPTRRTPTVPYDRLTATDWRMAAGSWLGTPYWTGGTTRSGADCSGFALSLHREVTGIQLPRTTAGQWEGGQEIPVNQVRPGDLLFFQTLQGQDAISHVGVVVGPEEFAHAGTSTGVTFAAFDHGYWQRHLVGARRFQP